LTFSLRNRERLQYGRPSPQRVQVAVQAQRELVGRVAQVGQPFGALDHAVEVVAVNHPQPASIGELVLCLLDHLDAPEVVAQVLARKLVVVSGHEHDARSFASLAQQLLHDVVVGLRPVPAAPQLPAVDDVADEVERLAVQGAKEVQQRLGLAAGRAEVDVGDPGRAHAKRLRVRLLGGCFGRGVADAGRGRRARGVMDRRVRFA
jgi:hypothetical protein